MRKSIIGVIGAVALASFALPAAANAQWSRHDHQHEQLDEEHGDVHDALEEEHAQAHEQGLSPWEHAQLHQDLNNQHAEADYAIELQHQREHQREQWRRQYGNQYGYSNGYRGGRGYRPYVRHYSYGYYGY